MFDNIETLQQGTWSYDRHVACGVRIIVQDWDYHSEKGYDEDPPNLNDAGEEFCVVYETSTGNDSMFRSRTCLSLDEAIELAENTIPGPIDGSS